MKITNIKIEKFRLLDNIEINLENIITTVALMFFKNGKFSIEQASHFANLSLYDFMDECKRNQIPVISYDEGELESEMKLMNSSITCIRGKYEFK